MKTSDTGSRKLLKSEFSDSESQENDSSDEESENVTPRKEEKASEYELQRLKRIEENKKRMEALGLHKMANTFMGSFQKAQKKKIEKKGKRKMVEEDEEYKPSEMEEEICSSSEEGESDEEKFSGSQKGKAKKKTSTPKKQILNSGILDDDAALMQAIALSLKDSAGFLDVPTSAPSQSPGAHAVDVIGNQKEGNPSIQEDVGKRKGKKMGKQITSRVQMTEDEMVIHFFHFDEVGKGNITLRDIQRVATAHDFTWSEKEISDMIYCFDGDGDGKLNLDDFRKIVGRCNMIKDSDNGTKDKV
ncbi:calmodulin-related [Abeliophyllum distichum]|uniref:Calmodulin-related n=1 Tax=Abeliophyllum distichum TaxID=126358 RepID=A0ABD1TFH0_9LAMI